jgi:hypothetical protein
MHSWIEVLLVGFLLPMVAAILGDWLWTKYHASDFAAQRSVSSTQKKIERLAEWLSNFETIYADPKRYTARMISLAVILIINWITIMSLLIMAVISNNAPPPQITMLNLISCYYY